jgi:hypothetical protein
MKRLEKSLLVTVFLLFLLFITTACKAQYSNSIFNLNFYSLENLYGDVEEIEIHYFCVDTACNKGIVSPDSINSENFLSAVNKDIVIDGKRTPNKRPCRLLYAENKLIYMEYLGNVGAVSVKFLYDNNKLLSESVFNGVDLSKKKEVVLYDSLDRPLNVTDIVFVKKEQLPWTNIKTYQYDDRGFCVKVRESEYYNSEYIYDNNGFIKERITTSKKTKYTTYTILEIDAYDNWVKRLVENDGTHCDYLETREIVYKKQ